MTSSAWRGTLSKAPATRTRDNSRQDHAADFPLRIMFAPSAARREPRHSGSDSRKGVADRAIGRTRERCVRIPRRGVVRSHGRHSLASSPTITPEMCFGDRLRKLRASLRDDRAAPPPRSQPETACDPHTFVWPSHRCEADKHQRLASHPRTALALQETARPAIASGSMRIRVFPRKHHSLRGLCRTTNIPVSHNAKSFARPCLSESMSRMETSDSPVKRQQAAITASPHRQAPQKPTNSKRDTKKTQANRHRPLDVPFTVFSTLSL